MFREFLRCEYSEENILFWMACEDLKKETSPEKVEEKARMIYEDYVSILSPREVFCLGALHIRTKSAQKNDPRGFSLGFPGDKGIASACFQDQVIVTHRSLLA